MSLRLIAAGFVFTAAALSGTSGAFAQANVMKECGAEYQSAKAANTLGGKKWNDFLAECRTRHSAAASTVPASTTSPAAPAQTAAPATPASGAATTAGVSPTSKVPSASSPAKPVSGGRAAMLDRQRACGTEWKAQKVELRKTQPDLKWPKFWSDCNKRMKAAAVR